MGRGFAPFAVQIRDGLERLARYVGTAEFQQDVQHFAEDMHSLADALRVVGPIAWQVGTDAVPVITGAVIGMLMGGPAGAAAGAAAGFAFGEFSKKLFGPTANMGPDDARKVLQGWTPDMGPVTGVPGANNVGNVKGPGGAFQSYPTLSAGIIGTYGQLLRDEFVHGQNTLRSLIYGNAQHGGWTATDRPSYLEALMKKLNIGADQPFDLRDTSFASRMISAMSQQEGRIAVSPNVVITVLNQTGGNPVQVVSQLPQ